MCHYESCSACQKNTRKTDQSGLAQDPKIAGKHNASTMACNISPAINPIMSDVPEVPTTPITPAGGIKRKQISPGASPPVVVEDKSMKLMENTAASLLPTPAKIQSGNTQLFPSKHAITQPNEPKSIPQTNPHTPTSGLRKRTQ